MRFTILSQALLQLDQRHGASQQEALERFAAISLQQEMLLLRFDAFRHHRQTEVMSQRDDCLYDRGIIRTLRDFTHETAVDLQLADR